MKITTHKNNIFIKITKTEEAISLQDFLKTQFPVPKTLLHEFRTEKKVVVNEQQPNWTSLLTIGDTLKINITRDEQITPTPSPMEIEVLYEDDHLLIVNKPSGVDTHPGSIDSTNTLSNGVAYYFQQKGIRSKVRHMHRLDKETSGAILFAKHALSGALLDKALEERKIKRTYIALVEGAMNKLTGRINQPIGKDRHHASRRRVSPNGQKAVTNFKVIKKLVGCTLVQLTLETGRTHQIRVHMSHIGHPLVGDNLYGAKNKLSHSGQALHAWKLDVPHPFNDEVVSVTATISNDFSPSKDLTLQVQKIVENVKCEGN
ncbi:RluA family pseudouridine synthase [Bacillus alkalisoli]|uniref:RluA family pseudouridine synthase n=1 Tax=Bacillus alkalisoli TaxID=2011008 RepID=UPI000C2513A8|nr:RluA family pseudouridine synthase [Bacillus alkalisoli]